MNVPIGCFVRPFHRFPFAEALAGIAGAGYKTLGLLGGSSDVSLDLETMSPDTVHMLVEEVAALGRSANLGTLKIRHDVDLDAAIASVRRQVEMGQRLGLTYLMTFGANHPQEYERFYAVAAAAAAHAQTLGVQVVTKPHGGCTASADEIQQTMERVGHRNFSLWYDAGNIVHYTGKDPVEDVRRVAHLVTGFCAKDCLGLKGDVMIQFGEGQVDFAGVFGALKEAGFDGPVMVECCRPGDTSARTAHHAAENRLFLEKLLAAL